MLLIVSTIIIIVIARDLYLWYTARSNSSYCTLLWRQPILLLHTIYCGINIVTVHYCGDNQYCLDWIRRGHMRRIVGEGGGGGGGESRQPLYITST